METTQKQMAPLIGKIKETEDKVNRMIWTGVIGNSATLSFVVILGIFVYWVIDKLGSLDAINNGIYQLLKIHGLLE